MKQLIAQQHNACFVLQHERGQYNVHMPVHVTHKRVREEREGKRQLSYDIPRYVNAAELTNNAMSC